MDSRLLDALVTRSFDVIGVVSRVAAAHDLSLTQLRVLAILRDRTPRMSELAAYLGLDRSSLTGLIARAVERGLIERVPDATDSRSVRVRLTEEGRALSGIGAAEIRAGVEPLVAGLSAGERASLAELLERPRG